MPTLFALMTTVFSALLTPIAGGELLVTKQASTSPVVLEINATSICTANLSDGESRSVAEVIESVTDHGAPGKLVSLAAGGAVEILSLGYGNVRISTRQLPLCRVALMASEGEPDEAIEIFSDAAL